MSRSYTVRVKLDAGTFRRFSRFDTLSLRKRWIRPVVFALILLAFSFAALLSGREQSGLIAAVLLVVGIGLPLVYFGSFFSQVNLQVKQHRLDSPRRVYTVRLDDVGAHVTNDQRKEEQLDAAWENMHAAFRAKDCIYLYVAPARAFLLPDGQADCSPEVLWLFIEKHMGAKAKRFKNQSGR